MYFFMKNNCFLVVFMLLLGQSLFGQKDSIHAKMHVYKWEIAADVKGLFSGNYPSNFLIRYNKKESIKRSLSTRPVAYRLNIATNTMVTNTTGKKTDSLILWGNFYTQNEVATTLSQTTLAIGKEYQHRWNRFVFFYGGDLILRFDYLKNEFVSGYYYINNLNEIVLNTQDAKTWGSGISPFMGAKVYFTPRIALSLESKFTLLYQHSAINRHQITLDAYGNELDTKTSPLKRNELRSYLTSLSVLNLSYHF